MDDYIQWHYKKAWPALLTAFGNLFIFPIYYFSIPLHLKTLFSPWRRTIVAKKSGFQINDVLGVISFNLTSRVLGIIIRSITIIYGLIFALLLPLLFTPILLLWPILPGLTLPFFFNRQKSANEQEEEIFQEKDFNQQLFKFIESSLGRFILIRLGLNPSGIIKMLSEFQGSYDNVSVKNIQELFPKIVNHPAFSAVFNREKIKEESFVKSFAWYQNLQENKLKPLILSSKRIKSLTGIGFDWAYGYTVTLDKFSQDLTKKISPYPFLLGREKEMVEIERALLKSENNNCLIIGEPGMARHILISSLSHNLQSGKCDPNLSHKRILQLDMQALFAQTTDRDKLKSLFSDLLSEALQAGNIIIFIDEIDKYLSTGEGRLDLTDVLEKFTQSRVGLIGITTPDDHHGYIEPNSTLNQIFTEIRLTQPTKEQVLTELELSIAPVLEKKYPCLITLSALEKTISDADRFLTETPFPGKAVELLEETVIWKTNREKGSFLKNTDIDSYLSEKMQLPVGDPETQEKEILTHLEELLHQRIINQHQAIKMITSALRRARLNISSEKKPIGSFLFLGPTGVGKTETAKALSEIYFKNSSEIIRFDMSQYQGEEGLIRLIGSSESHSTGELTSRLREKPFSLLLFDEIEKAPPLILNLFLTLLDEGYISDGRGKKISCKNTIIIATSNAGAEFIRESLIKGENPVNLNKNIVDKILKDKTFSPEFINRFDGVVVYTPLNEGQLKEVAKLMLSQLNQRLKKKDITLSVTPELINYLASLGNNLEFGARNIRREIETRIEDEIAQKVLQGKIDQSGQVNINLNNNT